MLEGMTGGQSPNVLFSTASAMNSDQDAQGFVQSRLENL